MRSTRRLFTHPINTATPMPVALVREASQAARRDPRHWTALRRWERVFATFI
jgi:hypothetical protein